MAGSDQYMTSNGVAGACYRLAAHRISGGQDLRNAAVQRCGGFIVADQAAAWNAGDGQACARHLAPEASFTNIFGMVMYGAPAFARRQ